LLLVRLIRFWSLPENIEQRHAENLRERLTYIEKDMASTVSETFFDTLCNEQSLLKRNALRERFIEKTSKKSYSILLYKGSKVRYWSQSAIVPDCDLLKLKEGPNFRRLDNGWYYIYQKTNDKAKVLCLFNVKQEFNYQNEYLKNEFNPILHVANYMEIHPLTHQQGLLIATNKEQGLFKLQINNQKYYENPSQLEILLYIILFIFAYLCINNFAKYLWQKGEVSAAIAFLVCTILLLRFATMYWQWPTAWYMLPMFSPDIFASNIFFPSLGDLLVNLLLVHWVVYFLFDKGRELNFRLNRASTSYLISIAFIAFSFLIINALNYLFEGLVINSNISFDLTNVLSLNIYSFIGFFCLSLMLYSFYLLNDTLISIFHQFYLSNREKINVFAIAMIFIFLFQYFTFGLNILFVSNSLFLLLLERSKSRKREYLRLPLALVILSIFAFASSLRLDDFLMEKERQNRKLLASKLASANDPIAEYLLDGLVKKIKSDSNVKDYFANADKNAESIDLRIQQLYFGGYFSKYDMSLFAFDSAGNPIRSSINKTLSYYDDLLLKKSIPTFNPNFFYQNNAFGLLSYYGKVPIYKNAEFVGHLIIELKSKYFRDENIFPELLLEGSLKMNKDFKAYSYCVYKAGLLVSQQGDYAYSLKDIEFKTSNEPYTFVKANEYEHLIYNPSPDIVIVVSKPIESGLRFFAIFSYLLGVFMFCLGLFFVRRYIGKRFFVLLQNLRDTKWNFRILFRTRIQLSLILTIVLSLSMVAYLTFVYITEQYTKQQNERLSQKVRSILISLERRSSIINYWNASYDERMSIELKSLSDLYLTDINIFGLNGELLISTQPKIFESALVSRYMNAEAYNVMTRYERSEFTQLEKIGSLGYLAAYAPIRNSSNKIVGYLNLPYFANKSEYENRVSQFLTAFINVYVFIFVIVGFLAFFIANQITLPLGLIQEQLRETKIGKKMDKIDWKGKDEIGRLIDEYNRMIEQLEESTLRLTKSERENAWREMAKQVAHEIKNPLTPMKLGVQHLQRAWIDKDPSFDEKFERFSRTIIQQIESLSLIASEFSNFAQMPAANISRIDIKELVNDVANLYRNEQGIEINVNHNPFLRSVVEADKDQMIRCFNNLVKNAIQAIPPQRKGVISIELLNVDETLQIIVQDNGSGIEEQLKDKIFQPNFSTKNSGMGMGLAIVNNIIKQANGHIWFTSSFNIGSTFYVSLPLYSE
jgi:signal transduction histidine kinase